MCFQQFSLHLHHTPHRPDTCAVRQCDVFFRELGVSSRCVPFDTVSEGRRFPKQPPNFNEETVLRQSRAQRHIRTENCCVLP